MEAFIFVEKAVFITIGNYGPWRVVGSEYGYTSARSSPKDGEAHIEAVRREIERTRRVECVNSDGNIAILDNLVSPDLYSLETYVVDRRRFDGMD